MSVKAILACIALASNTYSVPQDLMTAIYEVEGGYNGAKVYNKNGSYDMGVMQINSLWLDDLETAWSMPRVEIEQLLINDPCTSASVAAWIMRKNYDPENLLYSIGHYHSRTPEHRDRYIDAVFMQLLKAK